MCFLPPGGDSKKRNINQGSQVRICSVPKLCPGFHRLASSPLITVLRGFPWGLSCKRICLQCRRRRSLGFHPWVRKTPWRRKGQPLQYSCLGNPTERGAWQATVHGVAESDTTEHTHTVLGRKWACGHLGDLPKVTQLMVQSWGCSD